MEIGHKPALKDQLQLWSIAVKKGHFEYYELVRRCELFTGGLCEDHKPEKDIYNIYYMAVKKKSKSIMESEKKTNIQCQECRASSAFQNGNKLD